MSGDAVSRLVRAAASREVVMRARIASAVLLLGLHDQCMTEQERGVRYRGRGVGGKACHGCALCVELLQHALDVSLFEGASFAQRPKKRRKQHLNRGGKTMGPLLYKQIRKRLDERLDLIFRKAGL